MLLNRVEKLLMNNPVREAIQRHFEARRLLRMGGAVHGGRALEIGCGRGVGTEIILDLFGAEHVDAFDLDPDMVARARRRLSSRGDRVRLWVGDATSIDAAEASYEAVFDFGIIHHVPKWREALREVHRVLVPGGRFFAEEIYTGALEHWVVQNLLEHPREDRFDHGGLGAALEGVGFTILADLRVGHAVGWYVARKPGGCR